MKCLAGAVQFTERYNLQHTEYAKLFLDWEETALVFFAAQAYKTMRQPKTVQAMLDKIREWMIEDVTASAPETLRRHEGGRSWWADQLERTDDAIASTIWRWHREIKDYGFGDDKLDAMAPRFGPDQTAFGAKRQAISARREYWNVRGKSAATLYAFVALAWLAERKFSVPKIELEIYHPYAAEMRRFFERFLSGDTTAWKQNEARLRSMKQDLERAYGIRLAEIADPKEERPEEKPVNKTMMKAFDNIVGKPGGFNYSSVRKTAGGRRK